MESTIGGVLFDVWFKEGGQQKTMARNLKLHFYQSFKFTSPGMESRSSKRSTYIGADIGTHSRNVRSSASAPSALPPKADIGTQPRDVRFVPKADIVPPSTPPKLRRRNGFSCEALAVNKKG